MPGSTPAGGRITPDAVPLCATVPGSLAGGATSSGGVGAIGGVGPGGASVLDGGLDGWADEAAAPSATDARTAMPSLPPILRPAVVFR
jgi:hypothetical protein